jgi:glycosyltransferase involved in cell wall biosynthesis
MLELKRVDLLLEAVARICRDPRFGRLTVVGAGPERSRLAQLAEKLRLGDKCVFHEPVPPDQVREMMGRADVYVLPSNRYEGWGMVVNEGMSEGAVIVANDQAGASQVLIEHGQTGFLFRDGDVAGLAEILHKLMHDRDLLETVRQNAWREINRLWHPRVGAERLIGLCQGLLGLTPIPQYPDGHCRRVAVG